MTERPRVTPAGPPLGADTDRIFFIGTATTLIQVAGFTILTDPNFLHRGQRAYVGMGLTTRRLTEPALSVGELPPLDFAVLSHHHGDHFDRVAARDLDHHLPVLTEPCQMMAVLSADPGTHVRQVTAMQAMGATAVLVMNVPGADPPGTICLYGEHVLPQLRT